MKEWIIHLLGGKTEKDIERVVAAAEDLSRTAKAIIKSDTIAHAKVRIMADCARRDNCMGCDSRHERGYCKIGNSIPCQWEN